MPYNTNDNNYHLDHPNTPGYFYKNNSDVSIVYTPLDSSHNTFSITPPLNKIGLTLDSSNGSITGTTLSTPSDIVYDVVVTNTISKNVHTEYFRIVVSTEPRFVYIISSYIFGVGQDIFIPAPTLQAQLSPDVIYYKLTLIDPSNVLINIPINIKIDPKTGEISSLPVTSLNNSITINYTVKIINRFIEYEQHISIKIVKPLSQIDYYGIGVINNGGIFEFIQGMPGSLRTNSTIDVQIINGTYSISGCNTSTKLPLGLSFDVNTGTIFGIPKTISEPHTYTITLNNFFESKKVTIAFRIKRQYTLTPSLSYDVLITPELQMRKKAEILQHNSNKFNESKKQTLYNILTKGKNNNRSLECLSRNILISSSSSDVPGPSINLFYDPTVQLIETGSRIRPSNILPQ